MDALLPAFFALWIASPPALFGLWHLRRRRARGRNDHGVCADCEASFAMSARDRYLIQGRFVCATCARRARRRLARQVWLLAGAAVIGSGFALASPEPWMAILTAGGTLLGATAAFHVMKLANRRARARIAAGTLHLP